MGSEHISAIEFDQRFGNARAARLDPCGNGPQAGGMTKILWVGTLKLAF